MAEIFKDYGGDSIYNKYVYFTAHLCNIQVLRLFTYWYTYLGLLLSTYVLRIRYQYEKGGVVSIISIQETWYIRGIYIAAPTAQQAWPCLASMH